VYFSRIPTVNTFIHQFLFNNGHLSFTLFYYCVVNTRWERWDTKMTKVTKSPDLFNCILQMKKIVIFAFRISGLQTLNIHFHTLLYVFIIHTLLYYIGNEWELTKINENVWKFRVWCPVLRKLPLSVPLMNWRTIKVILKWQIHTQHMIVLFVLL